MLGRIMQWVRMPGIVQPGKYRSTLHDQAMEVKTSPRYTILIVNGVEYFFLRESGRFDGTGAMSVSPTLSDCRVSDTRR